MTSHGAATSAEVRFRALFCTAFNLNCTLRVSSECCAKLRRFGEGALLADGAQARLQGGVSGVVHVNPVFFFRSFASENLGTGVSLHAEPKYVATEVGHLVPRPACRVLSTARLSSASPVTQQALLPFFRPVCFSRIFIEFFTQSYRLLAAVCSLEKALEQALSPTAVQPLMLGFQEAGLYHCLFAGVSTRVATWAELAASFVSIAGPGESGGRTACSRIMYKTTSPQQRSRFSCH